MENSQNVHGQPEGIAIVGMSCRLPGDVSSPDDFWQLMSLSRSGWSEIPPERFTKEAYHHPNPAKKGTFNNTGGYFLKQDPALFDAPFFNITQQEAEAMGMTQRIPDAACTELTHGRSPTTIASRMHLRSV